jgi:teichuronic acid biosynthesis glycosyltransferase TuaC
MRVLIVTKIFPNALEPLSSPFNRQQFSALARHCEICVLATIPWFPGARLLARWSAAGRLVEVPAREQIGALQVEHPRFLFVPKIGHGISGPLYAASLARRVLAERDKFDVILGSWAYPDGYAAVVLSRLCGVPAVIKLHGSDMNVVAELDAPRRRLRWALARAEAVVAVSRALALRAAELGAGRDRIHRVPNGVDRALFFPRPRAEARELLGLSGDIRLIAYVGRLEREKGVFDLLEAFREVRRCRPDARLVLVGHGSAAAECSALASSMSSAVVLAGAEPLARTALWMAASDVVTLPSWNEGMPNAVLEALASGRRVVATAVGGIPEVVADPLLGELVPKRHPRALAAALVRALEADYDADRVARASGVPDWSDSAGRLFEVLEQAAASRGTRRAA